MESAAAAEDKRRAAATAQTSADQGELAAPIMGRKIADRTNFWNGYWNAEQANPKPTSRARTGNRVRFQDPEQDDLMDKSDPNRPFAMRHGRDAARKLEKRNKINKAREEFFAKNPGVAEEAERDGSERHAQEPVMQFPDIETGARVENQGGDEGVESGMLEEEKGAHYWD